jgi:hypothetical protein
MRVALFSIDAFGGDRYLQHYDSIEDVKESVKFDWGSLSTFAIKDPSKNYLIWGVKDHEDKVHWGRDFVKLIDKYESRSWVKERLIDRISRRLERAEK